jgi:adenosylcobinamide-phosphate synthase
MWFPEALMALLIELAFGYPRLLLDRIGHPVVWQGGLIDRLERRLNRNHWTPSRRRAGGVLVVLVVLALGIGSGVLLHELLPGGLVGVVVLGLLGSSLLAQRSLHRHVADVADALELGGLSAGRQAVSRIVGRDPERLDEAGVSRAAVESLAENFADGVVAPAFWLGVGGLAGGIAYKAINTADSMIGHRTLRLEAFGWAAARLDDLVNLPASRLAGLLLVLAAAILPGATAAGAWQAMWRDAPRHRSPNAGWPEAAMAGALGLALAGPRAYGGVMTEDGVMGQGGRRELTAADIRQALRLYWAADGLLVGLVAVLAVTLPV